MRLMRNLTIRWEMNFYDQITNWGEGISEKNELVQETSSAPLHWSLKSYRRILMQFFRIFELMINSNIFKNSIFLINSTRTSD